MGRQRRVCGGWARADRRWVSEEERRVCGFVEEERKDGEAVRRERWRKDNEGKNKKKKKCEHRIKNYISF